MEAAIREGIERRLARQEFIQRGLRGAEEARKRGEYIDGEEVFRNLKALVEDRRRQLKRVKHA